MNVNGDIVQKGDLIEIWSSSRGYLKFISKETRVQPLPDGTYKFLVNGELRVDLPNDNAKSD